MYVDLVIRYLCIHTGATCSIVVKVLHLHPQGRWFDPWCGQDKICTAVGPLSKALNPTLLQGVCLLLSLINCKSLWIKASAKLHDIVFQCIYPIIYVSLLII